jgi:hypothetical protein
MVPGAAEAAEAVVAEALAIVSLDLAEEDAPQPATAVAAITGAKRYRLMCMADIVSAAR